jgi:membrane dipeptidase
MIFPIIDLHEDISLYYFLGGAFQKFPTANFSTDLKLRHSDIPKFRKGGVKIVFSAIGSFVPTNSQFWTGKLKTGYGTPVPPFHARAPTLLAFHHLGIYYELERKHRQQVKILRSESDVTNSMSNVKNKIGFLISMEGAEPLEDVDDLRLFFQLGVRSVGFTWNIDNRYSSTCMSKKDYGLTGEGERLVNLCNELGIIIDISHASKKASLEMLQLSDSPLIASHANVGSVWKHSRNLDDEQLGALKENKGVIGVSLINATISKRPSVKSLADHVVYLKDKFGIDIIAIGTDYFGLLNSDEPLGLENISKFANLWAELNERGFSKSDIQKISFHNARRVIMENAKKWNSPV